MVTPSGRSSAQAQQGKPPGKTAMRVSDGSVSRSLSTSLLYTEKS